ncbi:serine/threonine-protein kinase pim-2 isoform X2 [Megalobrama amblycephala]|uniref:serine/threonine-protein kinase pim-2 isoform X2 n=1 Tax=Megalobrama amblycephala TaxID=75352 RepID=UPI002014515F|nr:serine/threonine-protein kinase pim-2 isoform X2 [Megalobrama amblycephala]
MTSHGSTRAILEGLLRSLVRISQRMLSLKRVCREVTLEETYVRKSADRNTPRTQSTQTITVCLTTFGNMMSTASVSVPKGSVDETGDVASWLYTISFCNDFCDWVDKEWSIDSLTADIQPFESTRASAVESAQPSPKDTVKKSPTEIHTQSSRRSRFYAFFKRAWKAIKHLFLCCRRTRVESPTPQLNPHQSDPKPSSVPSLSDWEPNNGSLTTFYEVKNMLGSGSFGRVFKGIRKSDEQEVAIKSLHKMKTGHHLFIRDCPRPLVTEVAMMLILRRPPVSPYVIEMYEWFDRPKVISLILEYPQPCKVLREFITDLHKLNEPIARGLMRQLVLAVQHCIDHSVFHNDIHADNILVNTWSLELKLIDFGCAHLVDSNGYNSTQYLGAIEYCPPEVFKRPKYHAVPTNVWALGIVLYMMMNGRLPFVSIQETAKACPDWNPDLSNACRDLISQCLNRSPAKRPTLKQILQHEWFNIQC